MPFTKPNHALRALMPVFALCDDMVFPKVAFFEGSIFTFAFKGVITELASLLSFAVIAYWNRYIDESFISLAQIGLDEKIRESDG